MWKYLIAALLIAAPAAAQDRAEPPRGPNRDGPPFEFRDMPWRQAPHYFREMRGAEHMDRVRIPVLLPGFALRSGDDTLGLNMVPPPGMELPRPQNMRMITTPPERAAATNWYAMTFEGDGIVVTVDGSGPMTRTPPREAMERMRREGAERPELDITRFTVDGVRQDGARVEMRFSHAGAAYQVAIECQDVNDRRCGSEAMIRRIGQELLHAGGGDQ